MVPELGPLGSLTLQPHTAGISSNDHTLQPHTATGPPKPTRWHGAEEAEEAGREGGRRGGGGRSWQWLLAQFGVHRSDLVGDLCRSVVLLLETSAGRELETTG